MPDITTNTELDLSTAASTEAALVGLFPALSGVANVASQYAVTLADWSVADRNTLRLQFQLTAQTLILERLLGK